MDVKKVLNAYPLVTLSICLVVIITPLVVVPIWKRRSAPTYQSGQVYFSADDGQSWSAGDGFQIPPHVDGAGKIWVRAYVFQCEGNAFVGYLEKYLPEAHDRLAAIESRGQLNGAMEEMSRSILIKKPGEGRWIPKAQGDAASNGVTKVMCPGTQRPATQIFPP